MKTATVTIHAKDPDEFGELIHALGLSDAKSRQFFEFGEYATLEIEIGDDMTIVGGRVVPLKKGRR